MALKLRNPFLHPTYKRAYVYGKHDFKFHKWKAVPSDQWLIRERSFPGIISEQMRRHYSRQQLETKQVATDAICAALLDSRIEPSGAD